MDALSLVGGVLFGFYLLVSAYFQAESAGPETAAGARLETGATVLGLDEPASTTPVPAGLPAVPAESATQKAVHDRLREALRESPVTREEPYACLEMLCRKLDDGPEVRAIVAAVRQGTPAAMLDQLAPMDETRVHQLAQQITDNQGIATDLAQWSVATWRAVQAR